MRKPIALLLTFSLLLTLAACGIGSTSGPDESSPSSPDKTAESAGGPSDFEELVVVDNDKCRIQITEIVPDSPLGYALKVRLENKSADKTLLFSAESAAINGVQCTPVLASEVAAGKKAHQEIRFADDKLEKNGITAYTDIELTLRVYDSDDRSAGSVARETVHVYPFGADKADAFVREAQDTDTILIDNAFVTVIVTGYEDDERWGFSANLFLVNKSDKTVMFSVDEASVNGFMADPQFAAAVLPEKCAFSAVRWPDGMLAENGIDKVEELELVFRAYDADDWLKEDLANQRITLHP